MASKSAKNAVAQRLAREQDLMRRMGERKHEIDVAKSLSSYQPGDGRCLSCLWNVVRGRPSQEAKNPLWGGDAARVDAAHDDGFYRPMR